MPFRHSSPASFGGTLPKGEGFGALKICKINADLYKFLEGKLVRLLPVYTTSCGLPKSISVFFRNSLGH